tara:strand:+ start:48 stop:491 length:444 start_codon:yes stop_codon:yes gene_type:complete
MSRGVVDPSLVLGMNASSRQFDHDASHHDGHHEHDHDHDHEHHHDHTHVEAVSGQIRLERAFERGQLEELLRSFVNDHDVIRLKGRLWMQGKRLPLQIQMVGPRLESWFESAPAQAWKPEGTNGLELVVIGLQTDATQQLEHRLQAV